MTAVKPPVAGDRIEVALRGTVENTRMDRDGLKVCLKGDGFYIWFAPKGADVSMAAPSEEEPGPCLTCGHSRGAHFREGCDADLTRECACRRYTVSTAVIEE